MFDPELEPPIALSDVPDLPWMGRVRRGRKMAIKTVCRWATQGIKGERLEVIVIAGRRYTSERAIKRFLQRATAATIRRAAPPPALVPAGEAEAMLDRLGI